MFQTLKNQFHKIRKSENPIFKGIVASKDFVYNNSRKIFRTEPYPKEKVFLSDNALSINQARMDHLAKMNLDSLIAGKKVLEVGAGIGLLTSFFEDRNCNVLSTDNRKENIDEMKKRYPNRKVMLLDLEKDFGPKDIGMFDVVFCYGTLYHLADPEKALKSMSSVCKEIILLETCVSPGKDNDICKTPENKKFFNLATSGWGCRPMRKFVIDELKKYFGYAYISKYQPNHKDFQLDWVNSSTHGTYRSIFVGSRKPISNPLLLDSIPNKQEYVGI